MGLLSPIAKMFGQTSTAPDTDADTDTISVQCQVSVEQMAPLAASSSQETGTNPKRMFFFYQIESHIAYR
jgi:hypothetical protein